MMRLFSLLSFLPAAAAAQPPVATSSAAAIPLDRVIAIVGTEPILLSEVEGMAQQAAIARREPYPTDSAERMQRVRAALEEYIDVQVIVTAAKKAEVEVDESQITAKLDQMLQAIRRQFPDDSVLRETLRREGFASIEAFRTLQADRMRDSALAQNYRQQLQQDGKFPHATVSEQEVAEFFNANRAQIGSHLGGVTFRQIVIPLQPKPEARIAARAKADSLRAALEAGAVFEEVAKAHSMDPSNRETGGDLGWWRRGGGLVPEFERWIFALPQGAMSPVFETQFGYHIARVDRVAPGEVKSRHILIRPVTDSSDVVTTKALADSVAVALRAGASFDSLAEKYHDPDEPRSNPTPAPLDSLFPEYKAALTGLDDGDVTDPFTMLDRAGEPTMRVLVVTGVEEPREYTVDDWRTQIRDDLSYRKGMRKLIDRLRREVYVSVQL